MIEVKIFRDDKGLINRYKILGHANYKAHGEDIVCAAVSILGYTALRSIVDVCGLKENEISYKEDEETGFLDVKLLINNEDLRIKNIQIVLKTLVVGIISLIESYPKYVTLEYRGGVMNA